MKEGDIYMNGMYHNPNENWMPHPKNDDERDMMIQVGCLGAVAFIVMMFILFSIMVLLSW